VKIWAKTKEFSEGKFLVVRRDGSIPLWPHFVLGARDPAAPAAIRAYAATCAGNGLDPEYVASLLELADDFDAYRLKEGNGDADAAPHRKDDHEVVMAMQGHDNLISVWRESRNVKK
jgi:hypothetical protein